MDPKTANLDPKLQAAYDRVMGTAMPQTGAPAPQTTQTNTPATPPAPEMPQSVASSIPSVPGPEAAGQSAPVAAPTPAAPQPAQTPMTPMDMPNAKPEIAKAPQPAAPEVHSVSSSGFVAQALGSEKKKSLVSTPILFLAAVVFFLIYAMFWMRFFNVAIPFLPQQF